MPQLRTLALATLLLLLAVAAAATATTPAAADQPFAVVGYLPEYRLAGFNYTAAFQTGLTHLIFFSIEVGPDGSLRALDRIPDKHSLRRARAAADATGGKILLGFGGNARSHGFGEMATNPATRALFLDRLDAMLKLHAFDGVDYNWEYPRNDGEWRAWYDLMRESKERLLGGKCIVTFTIYLDPNHYRTITHYKLIDVADYVLCMSYDQPAKHSTEEFYSSAVRIARQYQIPLRKFVNGLPFYGRDMRDGNPKTYNELVDKLHKKYGDAAFSADPADHGKYDVVGHQYFNSRSTIAYKTREAVADGIGGVMIWEIGQDKQPLSHPRSLMTALQSALPTKPQSANSDL